jgi:quinohemoprotein ethanol dehydrogenase
MNRDGDSGRRRKFFGQGLLWLALLASACSVAPERKSNDGGAASTDAQAAGVDDKLLNDDQNGDNWASYGRTFNEGHFSPLADINKGNVGKLGLAWFQDLDVLQRVDSQPLAYSGVIYTATGLSIVQAYDAATGKRLWRYDPDVAQAAGDKLRSVWGIRGLALWGNRVIFGTHDGRLISLDAGTGKPVWSTQALDPKDETAITGAPRVFNGKVLIGFGGADRSLVRGAVNCYDAATGKFLWRFYTVPGDPAKGFENEAMRKAAATWKGEWWKFGGGGTVWNAMTFDPEMNRVYIGTGNGSPWNAKIRSPGGGDNLYLASIIALDADTGDYIWHYQQNPAESWDYNAAMDIQLATLPINGQPRKVLMQAPKNGFFYVIDRETGKLLSAEKIGKVSWASRVDLKTGRPVENPGQRYESGSSLVWPGNFGAHGWQPMSYSPKTKLVYIPLINRSSRYSDAGIDRAKWKPHPHQWNAGLSAMDNDMPVREFFSALLAWDPAANKPVWKVPTPGIVNGGTMATGGDLVFQGHVDGTLNAYLDDSGRKVWSFNTGGAVLGAPISFRAKGRQYVSVMVGPVPAAAATISAEAGYAWPYRETPRRLLTFMLDGKARLPASPGSSFEKPLKVADFHVDPAIAKAGAVVYGVNCFTCHGPGAVSGGNAPDLRASPVVADGDSFAQVVRDGALVSSGMPRFEELTPGELEALRHYIRSRAEGAPPTASGAAGP